MSSAVAVFVHAIRKCSLVVPHTKSTWYVLVSLFRDHIVEQCKNFRMVVESWALVQGNKNVHFARGVHKSGYRGAHGHLRVIGLE